MKSTALTVSLALTAMIWAIRPAWTAPKPSEIPSSWQLNVEVDDPKAIEVTLPGQTKPERFWYVRFNVINRTGEDRIFVPEFELYTDTGQVLRVGQHVPSAVFRAIKELYNEPLLTDMTGMTGKLLQGEDNAKDGVAIWRDFDPQAGQIDLFLGGFSGETAEVVLPKPVQVVEVDAAGHEKTITRDKAILSRTYHLVYDVPGEASARTYTPAKMVKKEWIMR
jgi:hypothetical protein